MISPEQLAAQIEVLRDRLRDSGARVTRQREQVFELLLCNDHRHLSAEDVQGELRGMDHSVGAATVYRTLTLLVELGLATVRRFGDGVQRFESTRGEHHDHMICVVCGVVYEFEDEQIELLQNEVARRHGFEIVDHRLELFVRCGRAGCGDGVQSVR